MDEKSGDELAQKVGCVFLAALPFIIGGGWLIGRHLDNQKRMRDSAPVSHSTPVPTTVPLPTPPNPRSFDTRAAAAGLQDVLDGAEIFFDVEILPGRRHVKIYGCTNLPPGTKLMYMVRDSRQSMKAERITYFLGQSHGVVQRDCTFETEAFGPLEPAGYVAEVLMPIALVQAPATKAIIGDEGENLIGRFVRDERLGRVVATERTFSTYPP